MDIPRSFGTGIPGWTELTRVIQVQNRLLEQLPDVLVRLTEAVELLIPAVDQAIESVSATQRATAQGETLVNDLDGSIRRLIPAIERVAAALDHPAVDAVPQTLQRITETVVPVADSLARGRARMASVRGGAGRWVHRAGVLIRRRGVGEESRNGPTASGLETAAGTEDDRG